MFGSSSAEMKSGARTCWRAALLALMTVALVACAGKKTRAPVEDRGTSAATAAASAASAASAPAAAASQADAGKPLPGAENAGKPGYYTVKPGDRLLRIAMDNGQNWRDLVKWNNLENANVIEAGQVLRVTPPVIEIAAAKPVGNARPEARPPAPSGTASTTPVPATSAPPATPIAGADDVNWAWPANGPILVQFDEAKSKGLVIGGKAGDPVFAAADGRVVYAGSGLRGYGNLLIVKHNDTFLTAYAHNQALLVKEDQAVRRGQKIAEMGSTDAETVQLHFEIRRQGKPVDPIKLLPPR